MSDSRWHSVYQCCLLARGEVPVKPIEACVGIRSLILFILNIITRCLVVSFAVRPLDRLRKNLQCSWNTRFGGPERRSESFSRACNWTGEFSPPTIFAIPSEVSWLFKGCCIFQWSCPMEDRQLVKYEVLWQTALGVWQHYLRKGESEIFQ